MCRSYVPLLIAMTLMPCLIERILTFPYEEREGWDLNVMFANGVMYFEDHLSEARLKEK